MTIDLDAIELRAKQTKALQDAASEGPWWRTDPPWGDGQSVHSGPSDDPHSARLIVCEFDSFNQQFSPTFDGVDADDIPDFCKAVENMALIAHSRTDPLPDDVLALTAELRRLREVEAAARAVMLIADGLKAHAFPCNAILGAEETCNCALGALRKALSKEPLT